jgi:hypothetical protein
MPWLFKKTAGDARVIERRLLIAALLSIVSLFASANAWALGAATPLEGAAPPTVALHRLRPAHDPRQEERAEQVAEMLTSLLMVALGDYEQFELLDRTQLDALFAEKNLLLAEGQGGVSSALLTKLPLSDFTLIGEVLASEEGGAFTLWVVRSDTAQVLGASRFDYPPTDPADAITRAAQYVMGVVVKAYGGVADSASSYFSLATLEDAMSGVAQYAASVMAPSKGETADTPASRKTRIAFGHFVEIGDSERLPGFGSALTAQLIENYVSTQQYLVLARTQLFPLVVEDVLRASQYLNDADRLQHRSTDYLIHGMYRVNGGGAVAKISLYLFIEEPRHGRTLVVLQGEGRAALSGLVEEALRDYFQEPGDKQAKGGDSRSLLTSIEMAGSAVMDSLRAAGTGGAEGRSEALFLQALKELGVIDSKASTLKKLYKHQIVTLADKARREEGGHLRQLLDQSLRDNPEYRPAQLARATIAEFEGDKTGSRETLDRIIRSQDPLVVEAARKLLAERLLRERFDAGAELFAGIVGSERAAALVQQLLGAGYLEEVSGKYRVNEYGKPDQLLNQTHELALSGFDPDEAIQVFETLRALIYRPGLQVRYVTPSRFSPRAAMAAQRQSWKQQTYSDERDPEARLYLEMASAAGKLYFVHLGDMGFIPLIESYAEAATETAASRGRALERAIDGFAASAFLDPGYLKALVLLGHTLCQAEVGRCPSGRMIHAWVVAQTDKTGVNRRNSGLVNPQEGADELDGLIFLAAEPIGRVATANLSAFFMGILRSNDYFLQGNSRVSEAAVAGAPAAVVTPASKGQLATHVVAIRNNCSLLKGSPRDLRDPRRLLKYTSPMEELATLAQGNSEAASWRTNALLGVEQEYPEIYPYLLVATQAVTPTLAVEQDEMVAKVLGGELVPLGISDFLEYALRLFEKRVDAAQIATAKHYIKLFAEYVGISSTTAHDFAYLYYRVGDEAMAQGILRDFARTSFYLRDYTIPHVDGEYVSEGFDSKGRIRYQNTTHSRTTIYYYGSYIRFGMGEKPIKWELVIEKDALRPGGKRQRYSGNKNSAAPQKFAFGNGGAITGEIEWPTADIVPEYAAAQRPVVSDEMVSSVVSEALAVVVLDGIDPSGPASTMERMFAEGYVLDAAQRTAIKGADNGYAAGPLRAGHFPPALAGRRDVEVLIERLFDKGYLTVSGVPDMEHLSEVHQRVDQDFPDLESFERRDLIKALFAASKMFLAGYAEIYAQTGDEWGLETRLVADDAARERAFGRAVALQGDMALVCDRSGGLYAYRKVSGAWAQQQRLDALCYGIAMSQEWAAVRARGRVVLYKNEGGQWQKRQTLLPYQHLLRADKGRSFEYFGTALALTDTTLFIGDPAYRDGEVSVFSLSQGEWQLVDRLKIESDVARFGKSIAVNRHHLAVGAELGEPSSAAGQVFVYENRDGVWVGQSRLVAKDTLAWEFGVRTMMSVEHPPSLLVKSKEGLFRYLLSQ